MEQGTVQTPAPRAENHVELCHAIQEMDNTIQQLQNLLDKITGADKEVESDAPKNPCETPLSDMLSEGPDAIRNKTDIMHTLIERIQNSLF